MYSFALWIANYLKVNMSMKLSNFRTRVRSVALPLHPIHRCNAAFTRKWHKPNIQYNSFQAIWPPKPRRTWNKYIWLHYRHIMKTLDALTECTPTKKTMSRARFDIAVLHTLPKSDIAREGWGGPGKARMGSMYAFSFQLFDLWEICKIIRYLRIRANFKTEEPVLIGVIGMCE